MSTDFNIKPVGAPVAAPVVQHVSEAAQHAVATQLPASTERLGGGCGCARQYRFRRRPRFHFECSVSNQVVIDRDARAVVYQVVDTRTSQVVKQFPEEAVLRRRAYFHTLDLTRDAPAAPARHRPHGLSQLRFRSSAGTGGVASWVVRRLPAAPLRNASRKPGRDRSVRWRDR